MLEELKGQYSATPCVELICRGASGRRIERWRWDNYSLIAMEWNTQRSDNASYVPQARALARAGLNVAQIIAVSPRPLPQNAAGACLVQDLGDNDLLSLLAQGWSTAMGYYQQALEQLYKLSRLPVEKLADLQAPFDVDLYAWEQQYFAKYFLQQYLGLQQQGEKFPQLEEMRQLACSLADLPRMPVHRDFQAQNLMVFNQQVWMIDFQGLRLGRVEYDLASLLYDPYARLSDDQREYLLGYWQNLGGSEPDMQLLRQCAVQRLMQALGAYANLGLNAKLEWYLGHIDYAWQTLLEISGHTAVGKQFARLEKVAQPGNVCR